MIVVVWLYDCVVDFCVLSWYVFYSIFDFCLFVCFFLVFFSFVWLLWKFLLLLLVIWLSKHFFHFFLCVYLSMYDSSVAFYLFCFVLTTHWWHFNNTRCLYGIVWLCLIFLLKCLFCKGVSVIMQCHLYWIFYHKCLLNSKVILCQILNRCNSYNGLSDVLHKSGWMNLMTFRDQKLGC